MKGIIVLLFLLIPLCGIGQIDASWKHKLGLTVSPFPIINIFHPYGTLNLSYGISDRWAIEAGVGIVFPIDAWSGNKAHPVGRIDGEGYRFHLESKLKLKPDLFVSTELYHLTHDYTSRRYRKQGLAEIIAYPVASKVTGGNLLFGVWIKDKNFLLEMSGGLGLKLFNIQNQAPAPIESLSSSYRITAIFQPEENGNHLRLTIPLNLKLGVVF